MIICLCNGITSKEIEETAKTCENFAHLLVTCCYKKQCGMCFETLKGIWDEKNPQNNSDNSLHSMDNRYLQ